MIINIEKDYEPEYIAPSKIRYKTADADWTKYKSLLTEADWKVVNDTMSGAKREDIEQDIEAFTNIIHTAALTSIPNNNKQLH